MRTSSLRCFKIILLRSEKNEDKYCTPVLTTDKPYSKEARLRWNSAKLKDDNIYLYNFEEMRMQLSNRFAHLRRRGALHLSHMLSSSGCGMWSERCDVALLRNPRRLWTVDWSWICCLLCGYLLQWGWLSKEEYLGETRPKFIHDSYISGLSLILRTDM